MKRERWWYQSDSFELWCNSTEALSHWEMTQPPPVPDAGSCYGRSDRHQLSMPNDYSKEKADGGLRPNIDKSRSIKQTGWRRLLNIKYRAWDNASRGVNENQDQRWGFEDKAVIDQIARFTWTHRVLMFNWLEAGYQLLERAAWGTFRPSLHFL